VIDSNVPKKFINKIKNSLKKKKIITHEINSTEKNKNQKNVNKILEKLLKNNFHRNDCLISVGGGITGDISGFTSSIFKRGIKFINIPTTLLAQVDSSIGGKTGINSKYGKNLIGSFYQPKLVISDTSFLNFLSKKEIICGYAEILKHSLIKDKIFFNWLKKNTENIFKKKSKELAFAIKKSCQIKMYFVNKDINEKGLRMILNFGHTFAHAIEVKNNYSKKVTHGEAVLSGMILALRISFIKKICNLKTINEIEKIYKNNGLHYTYKKYSDKNLIDSLIPYLKNDKKNNDNKVNFILLKKIGQTTLPNKYKISIDNLKALSKPIAQY
jgi:3-dehydroquinate synthase/shikimate kinase/3-dehydroquinate synthase